FVIASAFMSFATYLVLSSNSNSITIGAAMGIADLGLGFLGIFVGLKIFNTLVPKFTGFTYIFGSIGRNTLPIYVLHLPLLALINLLLANVPMAPLVSLLYPFVALALVILLCLFLYRILLVLRLNFL